MPTDTALIVPAWVETDPCWVAALHVLQAPALMAKGVMRHMDLQAREIDFPALRRRARAWSDGERTLLAGAELRDLVADLDEDNLRRVIEAVRAYRSRGGR
jgi:hypothetical protein